MKFYEEAIHHLKTKFQQNFTAENHSVYVMGVITSEQDFGKLNQYILQFGISICCKQPFGIVKQTLLKLWDEAAQKLSDSVY